MNGARGRQKLAPRTPGGHCRGLAGLADLWSLLEVPGSPVILFHALVACSIGSLWSFLPVLSQCSGSSIPSGIRGGPFFSPSYCQTGDLAGRVPLSRSAQRIGPGCLWSISPLFLSFSFSSLPSQLTTRLLPSSSRRHLPGRSAFRSLSIVVSVCFRPVPSIPRPAISRVNRRPCDPAALCPLSALEHHQLRPDAPRLRRRIPKNTRARALLQRPASSSATRN
jgi:hypothetical protein